MPGGDTFSAPADAYDRFMGVRYGAAVARELVEFAGIRPGMRALDVGCGTGALTSVLTSRLGRGNVAAADPSEPFVAAARSRYEGVDVVQAPAEALPFADDRFDAALSQLVVNFMRDAPAGVAQMVRVTRPGGTVAAAVWDYAGEMTMLRAFWDAARDVDPDGAAARDEGVVMPWCKEGELAELWRGAGLADIRPGELVVRAAYAGFEDLWAPLPTGVGPAGAFCASLDPGRQAQLRDGLRARLGVGDEPFELTARAWAVAGVKPGG